VVATRLFTDQLTGSQLDRPGLNLLRVKVEKGDGSVPFLVDLELNASKGYHTASSTHRRVYHGRIPY